jgi:polyhydroxyalkanoate synthesis regulator phasin
MEVKEFLQKSLAFGLGTASFGAEKLSQFADDMVKRGEMSQEDAKKFIEDTTKRAAEEKEKLQKWVSEQVRKAHEKSSSAQAEKIAVLEGRIAELEKKLEEKAA